MKDYLSQAERALMAYLERGIAALEHARSENLEALEKTLLSRKAAFHNFRVADQLALDSGKDAAKIPQIQKTLEQIEILDSQLEACIESLLSSTAKKVMEYNIQKKKLGKYHSGASPKTKIAEIV